MLDRQKIFEDVVTALLKQGEKSVDHPYSSVCRYRKLKDDGTVLKCGIGHIIPDDKYNPEIDKAFLRAGREDVYSLIDEKYGETFIDVINYAKNDDRSFLNSVQTDLHDLLREDGFCKNLIYAAKCFADEWGLKAYNFS